MAKLELSYTGVGNVKYVAAMENSLAILQKTKHRVSYDPVISLLGVYPRDVKTYNHIKQPNQKVGRKL